MTLTEYITYALAQKQIEYHSYSPAAKYQCVDLVNDYITKVWGLEAIIGTDAKDFPERLKPGMEYVPNTTDYLPQAGEVVVWNGNVGGGAGHIAVVTEKGQQLNFRSLDQNWSKPLYITKELHNYVNVRGFIRKKGTMANVSVDAATYEMLVTKATKYDDIVRIGYVLQPEHDKIVSEKSTQIVKLESQIQALQTDLSECQNRPMPETEWEVNGKQVTTVDGNVTTTINYARKV